MVVQGIGRERKVNERCNRRSQRCTQERYRGKGTGKNAAGGAVGCSAEAKADGGTYSGTNFTPHQFIKIARSYFLVTNRLRQLDLGCVKTNCLCFSICLHPCEYLQDLP